MPRPLAVKAYFTADSLLKDAVLTVQVSFRLSITSFLSDQSTFLSNKLNFEKKLTDRPSPSVQCWAAANLKGRVQFQNKKILDHFSPSILSQKW
jgi:hypothetical protein